MDFCFWRRLLWSQLTWRQHSMTSCQVINCNVFYTLTQMKCNVPFYIHFLPTEIHRKANSKEVVRGPISAVTLNSSSAETPEEEKACCRNI